MKLVKLRRLKNHRAVVAISAIWLILILTAWITP